MQDAPTQTKLIFVTNATNNLGISFSKPAYHTWKAKGTALEIGNKPTITQYQIQSCKYQLLSNVDLSCFVVRQLLVYKKMTNMRYALRFDPCLMFVLFSLLHFSSKVGHWQRQMLFTDGFVLSNISPESLFTKYVVQKFHD